MKDMRTKEPIMAKYGKKASKKVERSMHEMKRGKLRSGRSGKKVTSRKQAIAIGLSEARREGGKVPAKKSSRSSASRSKGASSRSRSRSSSSRAGSKSSSSRSGSGSSKSSRSRSSRRP